LAWQEIFGFIGGALTTIAFIPQVWHLYRIKSAREISMPFTLMFLLGGAFWLTYGAVTGKPSVIYANSISLLLTGAMLVAKIKYGRTPAVNESKTDLELEQKAK
jgi:MtN3 and saliva related transmembrane protein